MASELERIRKYEAMGNKHLAAAESALRQHTLPNAPKLKFLDAVDLWHKAGKCFAIACEWEDSAHAFNRVRNKCSDHDRSCVRVDLSGELINL